MLFNSLRFRVFPAGIFALQSPAAQGAEILPADGKLLFLHVMETGIHCADPVFYGGGLPLCPQHGATSSP